MSATDTGGRQQTISTEQLKEAEASRVKDIKEWLIDQLEDEEHTPNTIGNISARLYEALSRVEFAQKAINHLPIKFPEASK